MSVAETRRPFLDALRGAAIVLMVLNHTGRWWIERPMGWNRYYLIYATVILAAPIFLFLVGFCLAISLRRAAEVDGRGAAALTRKYVGRGAWVIAAGWLLNALVFPEEPFWSGGVLQTIGLSILILPAFGPLLRHGWARWGLVALAAALYLAYAAAFDRLTAWVQAHPGVSQVIFLDFPPWPWVAVPMAGLALGRMELDRVDPAARRRFYATLGVAGLLAMAGALAWDLTAGVSPAQGFKRDFILNGYWTPGGSTVVWIVGAVLAVLAAARWLVEEQGLRAGGLVVLGRAAFMIYFVHQLIVLTLVHQALGVTMTRWWVFWAANAALIVGLVVLARAWVPRRAPLKQMVRARLLARLRPA
ncbi:MAG: heparan-alpha-glucosaminide N-acetyltransferase domain-containing protein [Candidatus Rokuibacteriota bacterium]